MSKATLKKYGTGLLVAILAAIFVTPPIVYILKFGMTITANHSRWAEFGSAMSGIYAPLLGALTLVVLGFQVSLQRTLTHHQQAQDFITTNNEALDSHLKKLAETLNRGAYKSTNADILKDMMADNKGDMEELAGEATHFAKEFPNIFVGWAAISSILWILKMHPHSMYQHAHSTSKLKIQSYFDHELCVALDSFHSLLSNGGSNIKYEFNEKLNHKI